jgi:hypothetical protein
VEARAQLRHEDAAGGDELAAEGLDASPLGERIPTVFDRALTFFVCHSACLTAAGFRDAAGSEWWIRRRFATEETHTLPADSRQAASLPPAPFVFQKPSSSGVAPAFFGVDSSHFFGAEQFPLSPSFPLAGGSIVVGDEGRNDNNRSLAFQQ